MNNRRKLLVALGAGALAAPLRSRAQQQGRVWRVGFLAQRHVDFVDSDYSYGPFRQGMRELGYVEGKNLVIEWRSAEGKVERLPDLAAELVKLKLDVIVAAGTSPTLAAQKATATIPIVMTSVDPVGNGLVKSLARPGGTATGLSIMTADLSPKHLELLLSVVPRLSRVAVLVNPTNLGNATTLKNVQAATQKGRATTVPVEARNPQEIEAAFSTMARQKATAIVVGQDPFFTQQRNQIAELSTKHRLPSISGFREYAEVGGLMSYGPNIADISRRLATYVDKILKGAKPADLPIEQPTKFELVINRKTAKTLGLTIPQSLLISADKVID